MEELFIRASRIKLRFNTAIGLVSVEDLWDLPLSSRNDLNLDNIARDLHKQVKESDSDVSFVNATKVSNEVKRTQMCFDIVKYIIEAKLAEREAAEARELNKAKKSRILEIIAKKQDSDLEGKTVEELNELVDAL